MITIAQEPLGLRRFGFSPNLSLLIVACTLLYAPTVFSVYLLCLQNALLPLSYINTGSILSFGTCLSPVTFSAQNRLTSELLRTL